MDLCLEDHLGVAHWIVCSRRSQMTERWRERREATGSCPAEVLICGLRCLLFAIRGTSVFELMSVSISDSNWPLGGAAEAADAPSQRAAVARRAFLSSPRWSCRR